MEVEFPPLRLHGLGIPEIAWSTSLNLTSSQLSSPCRVPDIVPTSLRSTRLRPILCIDLRMAKELIETY